MACRHHASTAGCCRLIAGLAFALLAAAAHPAWATGPDPASADRPAANHQAVTDQARASGMSARRVEQQRLLREQIEARKAQQAKGRSQAAGAVASAPRAARPGGAQRGVVRAQAVNAQPVNDQARASGMAARMAEQLRLLHEKIEARKAQVKGRSQAAGAVASAPRAARPGGAQRGVVRAQAVNAQPVNDQARAKGMSARRVEQQRLLREQIEARKAQAGDGSRVWGARAATARPLATGPSRVATPRSAAAVPARYRLSASDAAGALLMYAVSRDVSPVADVDAAFQRLDAMAAGSAAPADLGSVWRDVAGLVPARIEVGLGSGAETLAFVRDEATAFDRGSVLVRMMVPGTRDGCVRYTSLSQSADIEAVVARTDRRPGAAPGVIVAAPGARGGFVLQRPGLGEAPLDTTVVAALPHACIDYVLYKAAPGARPAASASARRVEAAGRAPSTAARVPQAKAAGSEAGRAVQALAGPGEAGSGHLDGASPSARAEPVGPDFALRAALAVRSLLAIASQQRLLPSAAIGDAQQTLAFDASAFDDPQQTVAETWVRAGMDAAADVQFPAARGGDDAGFDDPAMEVEYARFEAASRHASVQARAATPMPGEAGAPGAVIHVVDADGGATRVADLPFAQDIAAVVVDAAGCAGATCYAVAMPTPRGHWVLTHPADHGGLDALDEADIETLGDARVAMVLYRPLPEPVPSVP